MGGRRLQNLGCPGGVRLVHCSSAWPTAVSRPASLCTVTTSLSIGLLLAGLLGCANPVPPSGGPEDRTPPAVIAVIPEAEATNVTTDEVVVEFSEYIDQNSFRQALSVTPEFEAPLEITWRRRTATVRFPEPLRPNTTYILTLDTNLRDARRVALTAPLTVAFSTGPRINRGALRGRIVEPLQGTPVAQLDVYAYPVVSDTARAAGLPERPTYRTQTGADGTFAFAYLTEQPYYVVAVGDGNRNRQADEGEPYAVPPQPSLLADSAGLAPTVPWITTVRDATPPEVRRVRTLSDERLELRLSEGIRLPSLDTWQLADSARGTPVALRAAYLAPTDSRVLIVETAPMPATPLRLLVGAVQDSTRNTAAPDTLFLAGSADEDTLQVRFRQFGPGLAAAAVRPLPPDTAPIVQFNQAVDEAELLARVVVRDTLGATQPYTTQTEDGTSYRVLIEEAPTAFTVEVVETDTTFTTLYELLTDEEVGSRSGLVRRPDAGATQGPVIVELRAEGTGTVYTARADTTGAYRLEGLPAGSYRLRAFVDADGNGRWSGGLLVPYQAAEPILWYPDSLQVRPRWDLVLDDTLRIPPPSS